MHTKNRETEKPIIEIRNLSRIFHNGENEIRALDNISLTVRRGEFVAIMGQSGSGKSTLMNIIGCLDRPDKGEYLINGRSVSRLSQDELARLRRKTFGFIFQRYNLLFSLTAEENVEIPAVYAGLDKKDRKERALELLGGLGLDKRENHRPSELSGGQQQRVAIARALMNDPPVVLADEPTGALDSRSGEEVMDLLRRLHNDGRTIILITHEEEVARHAERAINLLDGKIVAERNTRRVPAETGAPYAGDIIRGGESRFLTTFSEAVNMAFKSLNINKFRTALTLLGIVIGVASVVAMLGIGNGSKQKVLEHINTLGTDLLLVRPGAAGIRSSGDIATLVMGDAEEISNVDNVAAVLPEKSTQTTLRYGNTDYQTTVQGVNESLPVVKNWPVAEGQFFNSHDIKSYGSVIVLGRTAADALFPPDVDPVGKFVLAGNILFEVIGVMSEKGASMFGSDQDDIAFIPITTGFIRVFGSTYLGNLTIKVSDVSKMDETQESIRSLLIERHKKEDFMVRNMASILEMVTSTQNTFTLLLGTIAAISLLVGGIGVMNIMLVSVTERTREIGIRMATGARRSDILMQFNIEAVVVCSIGGVLGVISGFAAGMVLKASGMSVIFSVAPAVLAFSSAFCTGMIFGYLPARKAARLEPVMSLASE
ncbi:MAG TPA: MacB family efflux pump subunit [Thermodesulfobacteriota bacterium]|nr:MacB family efflux pump subunit [Thermodesulfobacteriota bacterium]